MELPGLKECERLRLKAFELPCGKVGACFGPTPCELLPEGAIIDDVRIEERKHIRQRWGRRGFNNTLNSAVIVRRRGK